MLRALLLFFAFFATRSGSIPIPAASVVLGSLARAPEPAQDDEHPLRTVTVPAFAIDRTEVTRGAYAACVASGRCAPRADLRAADLLSVLPMTQVSWREADEYCGATGSRLPREAEWERAARGTDARTFPWGNEASCDRGNWGSYEGEGPCPSAAGRPVAVGSYPTGASADGVLDLAGNVWEWTADAYDEAAYRRGRARPVPRGPEELGTAPRRVVRGGGCCSIAALPRSSNRVGWPEDYRDADLGFRCAR